jgi:hypothetical protein
VSESASAKLSAILRAGGIPHKRADAFGSHAIVTTFGRDSAERAGRALQAAGFAVQGPKECCEENDENRGTVLRPTMHRVWRVWAKVRP